MYKRKKRRLSDESAVLGVKYSLTRGGTATYLRKLEQY